jgi:hypothetical protein
MTEGEWLACTDPKQLREHGYSTMTSERFAFRCGLYIVAHCHETKKEIDQIFPFVVPIINEASGLLMKALDRAERLLDGASIESWDEAETNGRKELYRLADQARSSASTHLSSERESLEGWDRYGDYEYDLRRCDAFFGKASDPLEALADSDRFWWEIPDLCGDYEFDSPRYHIQLTWLRDLFPYRPDHAVDASWLSWNNGTVPQLVRQIRDDRRYELMSILADALEDAGCDNADILGHCRGPGPHVRGCWVVNLLRGKE